MFSNPVATYVAALVNAIITAVVPFLANPDHSAGWPLVIAVLGVAASAAAGFMYTGRSSTLSPAPPGPPVLTRRG